jgi:hypothetical protein
VAEQTVQEPFNLATHEGRWAIGAVLAEVNPHYSGDQGTAGKGGVAERAGLAQGQRRPR